MVQNRLSTEYLTTLSCVSQAVKGGVAGSEKINGSCTPIRYFIEVDIKVDTHFGI